MIGTDASMQTNFLSETEMPGIKANMDQMQIICHRYYFASQFVSGKRVLEVGCGPGLGLGYLSRNAKCVIGGDITKDSLRCAREHYESKIKLVSMDAHKLPFRDSCFDVIISVAAIIYLDLPVFFNECYRVLKRGGLIILNTPNKDISNFRESRLSRNYFSAPELSELLKRHHFGAEFFGAFPVAENTMIKTDLKVWGGKVLNLVPKGDTIKRVLSNILRGRNLVLKGEIDDKLIKDIHAENIQLAPISCDSHDFQHRILYVLAYARDSENNRYSKGDISI